MDYAMTTTSPRVGRRPRVAIHLGGVLLAAAACTSPPQTREVTSAPRAPHGFEGALVSQPFSRQHAAALARESVLYAYHFRADTAELTALGRRSLDAMMNGDRSDSREVRVSPGACASEALGAARLASVRAHVRDLGFQDGQVRVNVGFAGGAGAAAKDVAAKLRAFEQRPMTPARSLSFELSR